MTAWLVGMAAVGAIGPALSVFERHLRLRSARMSPASRPMDREMWGWRSLVWPAACGFAVMLLLGGLPGLSTAALVWIAPRWWRRRAETRRLTGAAAEAPDLLELAACLAAGGLPPREALRRAAAQGTGALSQTIRGALERAALGEGFVPALQHASRALRLDEGLSLARALYAAETLGASLADVLRDEAARSRERQRLKAVQEADALPFKLSLVTAALFMPSLLIVVMVPSVLNFLARW